MYLHSKYINPFTDFGFKKLFGSEPNKDVLINFLNEVLPPFRKIKDLTYSHNEAFPALEHERKAIFDLYCTGENGEKFIVEMQKAKQNYFKDRSVFYATFPIQEQAQRGDWDFKLAPVYLVGILDFVFDEDKKSKEVQYTVQLTDQNCDVFYDKLTFIFLEMPKFTKNVEEIESNFDKWLYVLKHLPELEERPKRLQERVFEKLFKSAEIARFSTVERDQYEASLKYYRDLKNVVDTSFEEGKIEGKIEIARNGLKAGLLIEILAQLTGFSEDKLRELAAEL